MERSVCRRLGVVFVSKKMIMHDRVWEQDPQLCEGLMHPMLLIHPRRLLHTLLSGLLGQSWLCFVVSIGWGNDWMSNRRMLLMCIIMAILQQKSSFWWSAGAYKFNVFTASGSSRLPYSELSPSYPISWTLGYIPFSVQVVSFSFFSWFLSGFARFDNALTASHSATLNSMVPLLSNRLESY